MQISIKAGPMEIGARTRIGYNVDETKQAVWNNTQIWTAVACLSEEPLSDVPIDRYSYNEPQLEKFK